MKLNEYQGNKIFRKNKIMVPKGFLVRKADKIKDKLDSLSTDEYAVKAQVLVGGRGKAGGVKFATKKNIIKVASSILGKEIKGIKVEKVLIAEKLDFLKEIYVSITVNRVEKDLTLIVSPEGGVDIEKLAGTSPKKIIKIPMNEFSENLIRNKMKNFEHTGQLIDIIKKLHRIMMEYDAELVEINPLAVTCEGLVALDSKIILDDNALFRHQEFIAQKKEELTAIEKKADEFSIQYVELGGNIAIIGNGAGLVMATLDVLAYYGGRPANFLDVGGGASVEKMERSLEICMLKKPKGIFINIFGGITRCDYIAQGLVDYVKLHSIDIPMVVRLIGTNEKEGQEILKKNKIAALPSMEECAKKIIELVRCQ